MQGTKKQSFFVIVIVVIVLGIASLVGVMVSRPPSATIGNASSHTTPRIVREDLSLAHNYKSLKELRTDSTLIVQGTVNT
ncbi:MAG TPA: hypothetical protein DHW02_06250, partial [Ktedonobacter sp.]|nr:hypothetical protein [Ktedonobacter sp.]